MERSEKIAICKKVLEGTRFKIRIDYFGDGIIESTCGVTMGYHDDLYKEIFKYDDKIDIRNLNHRLDEHNKIKKDEEIKKLKIKHREAELRYLYLN